VEGIIQCCIPMKKLIWIMNITTKEVCLTAHSIFIVSKKVLHPNRLIEKNNSSLLVILVKIVVRLLSFAL